MQTSGIRGTLYDISCGTVRRPWWDLDESNTKAGLNVTYKGGESFVFHAEVVSIGPCLVPNHATFFHLVCAS